MTNSVYDLSIQQLSQLFLDKGFKWQMYFPQLLLKQLHPFLDQNNMFDYFHVVSFHIIICPRENILIFFEQVDKVLPLLLRAACTEIDKLQKLFCS